MISPLKSIRAKCLDCCCGQKVEVRLCPAEKCPLYPYRLGHYPKGAYTRKHKDNAEENGEFCEEIEEVEE